LRGLANRDAPEFFAEASSALRPQFVTTRFTAFQPERGRPNSARREPVFLVKFTGRSIE